MKYKRDDLSRRQQELREQMKAMLKLAIDWSEDEKLGYYVKEIDKDEFLVFFGVRCCAGQYARMRYFKDFEKLGVFVDLGNGTFKVVYQEAKKLAIPYGVSFEALKPKTEESQ